MNDQLRLRHQYLTIMNGIGTTEMFMYLNFLDSFTYRERMAEWLIENRIIGIDFIEFVTVEHKGSMLEAGREIVRRVNREKIRVPILVGRDFN